MDKNDKALNMEMAELSDIDSLLPLIEKFYEGENLKWDPRLAENALSDLIGNKDYGQLWCVKINNEIIGYAALTFGFSLEFGGRDAFIDEIYIETPFRGKGYAKKVLSQLLHMAGEMNIKAVHLEVDERNKPARHIYEGLGFKSRSRLLLSRVL